MISCNLLLTQMSLLEEIASQWKRTLRKTFLPKQEYMQSEKGLSLPRTSPALSGNKSYSNMFPKRLSYLSWWLVMASQLELSLELLSEESGSGRWKTISTRALWTYLILTCFFKITRQKEPPYPWKQTSFSMIWRRKKQNACSLCVIESMHCQRWKPQLCLDAVQMKLNSMKDSCWFKGWMLMTHLQTRL